MLDNLEKTRGEALAALDKAQDAAALEGWRTQFLGRNSSLLQSLKQLGTLTAEERPKVGQKANEVKQALETALEQRSAALLSTRLQQTLTSDRLDVSLPGRSLPLGR